MKVDPILPDCDTAGTPLQSPMGPPHHILVVDDDVSIRQRNTKVLLLSGYAVNAAEDGAAAWEALSAARYDLLITDHSMPKLTGVELIQKVRAAHMALPVIMTTGTLPQEEFTRYPWLQPEATLLKPYAAAELLGTVQAVLRATVASREPNAPPPNWQGQPSNEGLQL